MHNFLWRVIKGREKSVRASFIRLLLSPCSLIYGAVNDVRRLIYEKNTGLVFRSSRPVISVGNIAVGGAGKTPLVIWLAKYLLSRHKNPVVLTRGFMAEDTAESDEAQLLNEELPGVPVYVSPDRVQSMLAAEREHLVDAFIMDDGFQHWPCARDLDIVLIDAMDPFGNGNLLPCGILRESPAALGRADILVLTRCDLAADSLPSLRAQISRIHPGILLVETMHDPVGVRDVFAPERPLLEVSHIQTSVCACSAIASPDGFTGTLGAVGAKLMHHQVFTDHHVYTEKDVLLLAGICRKKGCRVLVVTCKDAVKLRQYSACFDGINVYSLVVNIKFLRGEHEFLACVDRLFSA